jgi:hypothetical protein
MAKLSLKDGYEIAQVIQGDGIVDLIVRKKDGTEDDVIFGQVIDGKFVIPGGGRELGKDAKLVYQIIDGLDRFGVFASESGIPSEDDFDVVSDTELAYYVAIDGIDADPDQHVPGGFDADSNAIVG